MAQPPIPVTIVLPMSSQLLERIKSASPRLQVTYLSRTQRYLYRDGRPLWAGYAEEPEPEDDRDAARRALDEILAQTEVLLSNPMTPEDILDRAPALRWLQLTSAGVDRLLTTPVVQSGRVTVTTASGLHAVPISEYILGAILAFAKGFPGAVQKQQQHAWQPHVPQELEGATVGVLGLGAIGRRAAELCKGLGMRVLAVRRSAERRMTGADCGEPAIDELLPRSDLPTLLAESDYLVLAVPLTDESRGMIGEAELRVMKPNAVIINVARGAVIDQPALIAALREGRIGGAALDVTDPEPLPADHELWDVPNVMITPHISGGTPRYMDRAIDIFVENFEKYLSGERLRNVVDLARGY